MADDNKNNNAAANASTDPNKGDAPDNKGGDGGQNNPTNIDFSKVSDDQLVKVLEDKRFWNLPRIKELRDQAKEAKTLKDKQTKDEEERLKKQGEFEQLSITKQKEADDWKSKYEQSIINNRILQEAGKVGITRFDLVEKLIDRSNIKLGEDGNVSGVTEAIDALLKDNDFLTSGGTKNSLGGGTNPTGDNNAPQFTLTQIQDPDFYQKNRVEIIKAQATGRIIDDRK